MQKVFGSGLFILILLCLDGYVFQAVRHVLQGAAPKTRMLVFGLYWFISALTVLVFLLGSFIHIGEWPPSLRIYMLATLFGLLIAKIIAAFFFLVDDIRRLLYWSGGSIYGKVVDGSILDPEKMTRSNFLSWLGIGVGTSLFGTMLWGYRNKYRYQIRRIPLSFDTLPDAFKGLRIVQLSDIHSGSFTDRKAVEEGIAQVNRLKPDLILFTGDLVNDRATEMEPYISSFAGLTAPLGVFSILGNHDYGDYAPWPSQQAKRENLDRLKKIQEQMGWRLLLNEHVLLEKNGASIALIGVENWGAKANFARYGRLKEAYTGSETIPFKILMSHDPSHWEAEVAQYPDIQLTLSGHTHGMQFGLEIPGFKWSPVQYVYRQWAGLYTTGNQKLYVNRGFGFIGYPGRVGILPEITLIELS